MFENVLHQSSVSQISDDIKKGCLPNSILLAGPENSGKLTSALELARILSCAGESSTHIHGKWNCDCPKCFLNKELSNPNIILCGPGDCITEICACKDAFLRQALNNSSFLTATHYLFIRSVRKLTMRFSSVLWEGDDKVSKISALTTEIEENLDKISVSKPLMEGENLRKCLDEIVESCKKLESGFLYDSLPIAQIRRISSWARLTSDGGKKVVIIENADRMNEGARNALLKILEEPPRDLVFVLTASRKGSVMATILSRVRPYVFKTRTEQEEREIIDRVFHPKYGFSIEGKEALIEKYLQSFLDVKPEDVKLAARNFYDDLLDGKFPDCQKIVKECNNFDPRLLLKTFLNELCIYDRELIFSKQSEMNAVDIESNGKLLENVKKCWNNVSIFNQNAASSLEILVRDFLMLKNIYR